MHEQKSGPGDANQPGPGESNLSPIIPMPGAQVKNAALVDIAKGLGIFYDYNQRLFWIQDDRGVWILISSADVKRELRGMGFRSTKEDDENLSQVETIISTIQRSNNVDYAGSLAGYRTGFYSISGKRILVRDSPVFIQSAKGEWPILRGILFRMLGEDQILYLIGWLKVAIEALYNSHLRPGQALVLAGPRNCGKSLLQNLITILLGGRSCKAYRYMSGKTIFNSDLMGAEHLVIEDEQPSTDIRARRNFGAEIKIVTANEDVSSHAKNRNALTLKPFWRISISVNDETENLMILPPIDESLQDKFIIFKAEKHDMPMPTGTHQERNAFISLLRNELPAFVDYLFEFVIPESMAEDRYGIQHFHHPDILAAISDMQPETKLLELIETAIFGVIPPPSEWEGSANELERKLTCNTSDVRREAERLISFPQACGTYLGRLQKRDAERFKSRHSMKGNIWTIMKA